MSDPSPRDEHHAAVSAWISQEFRGYFDEKMGFYLSSIEEAIRADLKAHEDQRVAPDLKASAEQQAIAARRAIAEILEGFVIGHVKTLLVMGAPGNMPKGILSLTNWEIVSQYFIDTYSKES